MLLVFFATLCVSLTAGRVVDGEVKLTNGEDETLQWPEKYTVKANKLSLTANLVEDYVIWKNNQSSRMDLNHGAVKFFTDISADYNDSYVKYQVHPITDKDEKVYNVCYSAYAEELDDILPDLDLAFNDTGYESIADKMATRFEYTDHGTDEVEYHVLWATDDIDMYDEIVWIPIRYEVKQYNSLLGSLTKHVIWEFDEFDINFNENEIFDPESFGCEEETVVKVTLDSEIVTKELMFIDPEKKHHVDHVFNSFKNKFNRKYAHEQEHNLRKSIFKQNMRLISATNRQNLSYKLGVNQFADRTPEELKKRTGLLRRPEGKSGNMPFPYTEETLKEIVEKLPTAVDLRLSGLVTPVRDQQKCGSCWTFGTTSAMEGALARKNGGRLVRLSNQALIDCAWAFGAGGCNGGTDDAAYEWMINYGLPTEEEYGPYANQEGYCHIKNMTTKYPIKGYTDVTPFSKEALKVALYNHGPLSVSVHVTTKFGLYSRGIYYEHDCQPDVLNHEVTLIGYGEQNGDLFWILKNSWGVNWGLDGYMMISARNNICGVATEPTYITL